MVGDGEATQKADLPGRLSRKAIQAAVMKEGLTHPLTLYPPAVALLSGLAGVLFSYPPLLLLALGAGVLGIGSGIVQVFLREEALSRRYLKSLAEDQAAHERRVLENLKEDLEKSSSHPTMGPFAQRGLDQFGQCQAKFKNVEELLADKFRVTEMTFGRFQYAAKQVMLGILDNLGVAADVLKSAGTIDEAYNISRLKALAAKPALTASDQRELRAVNESQRLFTTQMDLVAELLAKNEEAMTRLEETTSRLALMDTDGRLAGTDFETAIMDLQEMAKNAHQYNTKPLAVEKV